MNKGEYFMNKGIIALLLSICVGVSLPNQTEIHADIINISESSLFLELSQKIDNLYSSITNGILKSTVTQNKLDELKQKVEILNLEDQKKLLYNKINKIEKKLSEIQIKSKDGQPVVQVTAMNNGNDVDVYVRTFSSFIWENSDHSLNLGRVTVKEHKNNKLRTIFHKNYTTGKYVNSNKKLNLNSKNVVIEVEVNDFPLTGNPTVNLPKDAFTGTYTFIVEDGILKLQSFISN